jgi:hypothetical protein
MYIYTSYCETTACVSRMRCKGCPGTFAGYVETAVSDIGPMLLLLLLLFILTANGFLTGGSGTSPGGLCSSP